MRPRSAILLAIAIVYIVANWIPFGGTALYPLTLFTTWVHEMGHGLTALAMGGQFEGIALGLLALASWWAWRRPERAA